MSESPELRPGRTIPVPEYLQFCFWLIMDNLGLLLIANVLFVLAGMSVILLGPALLALMYVGQRLAWQDEMGVRDFLRAVQRYLVPGIILLVVMLAAAILLIANVLFYLRNLNAVPLVFYFMTGLFIWLSLFVGVFYLHFLPALVYYDLKWKRAARTATLLLFDNVKLTAAVVVIGLLLFVLGGVFLPAALLFIFSLQAVFMNAAFRCLAVKYGMEERDIPEENRGLRDLLRPWDMS